MRVGQVDVVAGQGRQGFDIAGVERIVPSQHGGDLSEVVMFCKLPYAPFPARGFPADLERRALHPVLPHGIVAEHLDAGFGE